MYIGNFLNDRYITLNHYCAYLNKNNSIIVDFKYEKRNNILQEKRYKTLLKFIIKNKLRAIYNTYYSMGLKKNIFVKSYYFKKLISKLIIKNKKGFRSNISKHYYFMNANVNLYKPTKRNRLLKLIIRNKLKKQVFSNALLFDGFLKLNLHPLFFKRFKTRFIRSLKKIKSSLNFNNYPLYLFYKVIPKILNFRYLFLYLSNIKDSNIFYKLYFNLITSKILKTLNFESKYVTRFSRYFSNLKNINYINVSFKLLNRGFKKKDKRKTIIYLKKFKKINFFKFISLSFLKLVIFLFLYWFNKLIILFNINIKVNILSGLFKPIRFFFKSYIWRKKKRYFFLNYNQINNFIFFNYKNRLVN